MTNEHTPEPWEARWYYRLLDHPEITTADGRRIAVVAGVYPMSVSSEDANARRIVACINACAGISTDYLESASTKNVLSDVLAARTDIGKAPVVSEILDPPEGGGE